MLTHQVLPARDLTVGKPCAHADDNSAWASGSQNVISKTLPLTASNVPDYLDAGPNGAGASSLFAACLRDWSVTATWTVDAACTPSGTGVWKGIPATSGDPLAKIAGATAATTGTARLRFGFKVGSGQPAGRYSAGLTFEVLAPNA